MTYVTKLYKANGHVMLCGVQVTLAEADACVAYMKRQAGGQRIECIPIFAPEPIRRWELTTTNQWRTA